MSSLQSRILVAAVGVPVLLYVVLAAPPIVMLAALCVLAGVGGMELQRCVSGAEKSELVSMGTIAAAVTVGWIYDRDHHLSVIIMLVVLLAFFNAIEKGGEVKFSQIMAGTGGSLFIGWSFASFLRLEASGVGRAYLLLPFILSFACDTFAFFAGLTLGKHKLAPKVSPKKTVEGSVGGLLGNVLCGLLFVWVMDRFFGGSAVGYGPMALLALLCGIVAQIGDLSFSLIKREFGIKDYGHLFLAHGGVLDRFDSVLFVAPVVEIIFSFLE